MQDIIGYVRQTDRNEIFDDAHTPMHKNPEGDIE